MRQLSAAWRNMSEHEKDRYRDAAAQQSAAGGRSKSGKSAVPVIARVAAAAALVVSIAPSPSVLPLYPSSFAIYCLILRFRYCLRILNCHSDQLNPAVPLWVAGTVRTGNSHSYRVFYYIVGRVSSMLAYLIIAYTGLIGRLAFKSPKVDELYALLYLGNPVSLSRSWYQTFQV